jgi:vitamin B12 transporter
MVPLDPVVVSASRIPTSLAETTKSATVITREQIEARQAQKTVDLLRQLPGVHIDQPGGRGSVSSVYVRGSDPNFTVVVIDGIKVNDPTNSRGGSFDFSTLDPASIERVEIVRGLLSSVYGSDAMGGVINIVTRPGSAVPERSVDGSGGRYGYHRAGLEARGPLGSAHYALSLSYVDDGSPVEGSTFTGKSINAKVTLPPSASTSLQTVVRYADSQSSSFPDDSGGPEFAVLRDTDKRDVQELTVGTEFNHDLRSWWEYGLKVNFYERGEDVSSPGVASGIRDPFGIPLNSSANSLRRANLLASNLFSFLSARVGIGAELQFEEGAGEGFLLFGDTRVPSRFELGRTVYAAFLEAQHAFPFGLTIQGGVRIDAPDDFDPELSPHLGALYRIESTQTTLKANWGEGFKLPSFFALGNPIVGNRELLPETSRGFDIGVVQELSGQRVSASATFFQTTFSNLIDLDEGPPPRLVNRSQVITQGVELSLALQPAHNVWINSHLTYLETDIHGTDEELRNRPEWRGGINARWRPRPDLDLNFDALYVGEVGDSSIPTGDRILDDYLRVNVAATWALSSHWQVSAAVDNLFDAHYEEAIGFPSPGVTPRIALRLRF